MPDHHRDEFRALLESVRGRADGVRAEGLRGSSRAYVLSRLLRGGVGPALVLTSTLSEARTFADEITFFLGADRQPPALPREAQVVVFPGWETLPFEAIAPLPEVAARRISALYRARQGGPFVLVAPVAAALQRTLPPEALEAASLPLSVGGDLDRDELAGRLVDAGYRIVGQVEERGEASLRGGIIDVYPPFYREPLRIELLDDSVESIRSFDPSTQRSTGRLAEAVLLPAREVLAGRDRLEAAVQRLRRRCRELGFSLTQTAELLERVRSEGASPLWEVLQPYFYDGLVPLWDHLPAQTLLVFDEAQKVAYRASELFAEAASGHVRAQERGQALPRIEEVFLTEAEWTGFCAQPGTLELEELEVATLAGEGRRVFGFETQSNRDVSESLKQKRGSDRLLTPLIDLIRSAQDRGQSVHLVARSAGSAQKLRDLLGPYGVAAGSEEPFGARESGTVPGGAIHLSLGRLDRGFRFPSEGVVILTEAEVLGEKVRRPAPRRRAAFRSTLGDLEPGDPLVHADFGIGLYRGLIRLDVQGEEGDYLHLEYADGDRLYLPVTRIGLVQKYWAPTEAPPRLDKLGGKGWDKARRKAQEGIEKMAHELLELYALRQLAERPPYSPPDAAYREFEATFPYEETPDQLSAISDVLSDMSAAKPMDRLICGDVGYGKTEVAIRAALRAVLDGRQVAVLVPTTVLAAQHFENFRRRFEGYPILVEMLSRFVGPSAQKDVCDRISRGQVDVVVGTHRLLQRDIRFKNLGLVVVDEEHRFGVAQKERLKKLRTHADVLTLSATPIPRTLQMGFTGVRDLSIIETPPADRQAVRTLLARFDDELIRDAIRRELARGGQVFFVHNRVQSIAGIADHVSALVPEARVGVGHGQMREDELERVMKAFVGGEIDVFVCTAIIESGLDIPRANTILIHRADQFGLADLYQLRGRVGRSNLRAYAYLLVPGEADITEDARKRLQALQEFTELGAGFKIATHDLEIRGAGELLGKAQSGQMTAIGFELYADLLEEAVGRLQGREMERSPEPEIHLRIPAHFPVDFVPDPHQRLVLYERLTRLADDGEREDIRYELIDRYGPLPDPVENLLEMMKIRRRLVALRAESLDYTGRDLVVGFGENPAVDTERVIALIQSEPSQYRLTPDHRLKWAAGSLEAKAILGAATDLLNRLG